MESLQLVIEQRNALREQNEKLQGSIRSQETIIQQLTDEEINVVADRDKYKKAFDEIFDKNVGQQWEKFMEEEGKEKDTLEEKIAFFNRIINNTKLYILDKAVKSAKEQVATEITKKDEEIAHISDFFATAMNVLLGVDGNKKETPESCLAMTREDFNNKCQAIENKIAKGGASKTAKQPVVKKATDADSDPMNTSKFASFANLENEILQAGEGKDEPKETEQEKDTEQNQESISTMMSNAYISYEDRHQELVVDDDEQATIGKVKDAVKASFGVMLFKGMFPKAQTEEEKKAVMQNPDALKNIPKKKALASNIIKAIGQGNKSVEDIANATNENSQEIRNMLDEKYLLSPEFKFVTKTKGTKGGGGGRPKHEHELTAAGLILYDAMFPDERNSLCQIGIRYSSDGDDQKSPEHRKLNETMKECLTKAGFIASNTEVTYNLSDGKAAICDILAEKNGKEYWIECEIGSGSPMHYKEKLSKIVETGFPKAYFITPNQAKQDRLEKIFGDLVNSPDEKNAIKRGFYAVTTIEKMKDEKTLSAFLERERKS